MAEAWFARMLSLERKRAERSHKPFLLLLLHFREIGNQHGEAAPITEQVLGALASFTRETDIIGWHSDQSVLGVIFTEIGGATDLDKSVNSIFSKASTSITERLGQEKIGNVKITCHVFPDHWTNRNPVMLPDWNLYPNLSQQQTSRWLFSPVKRMLDIFGSVLAMIVFLPLVILIALSIKLTSEGPVLFRQQRVGQFGRRFTLLKFRSMYVNSNGALHENYVNNLISGALGVPANGAYKIQSDPRVTPLGRLLRKTSLDELPQFWNVIKGEMSLVGPRPPVPYEVEVYDVWHRQRCLSAKPGITGLWQVTGRSRVCFDDMVRLDLRYSRTSSLWLDLLILVRTPIAVLGGDGAY